MSVAVERGRFRAGGVLRRGDLYIERGADARVLTLLRDGELATVVGPRQTGKSSLKVRLVNELRQTTLCGAIDLTAFSTAESHEALFGGLIEETLRCFKGIDDAPTREALESLKGFNAENGGMIPAARWHLLLRELGDRVEERRVVLLFDEIDSTLRLDGQLATDFWETLRAIFLELSPDLTFGLFGVFDPDVFIHDRLRSPFNVGQRIELGGIAEADLPLDALAPLGGDPVALRAAVFDWTDGHPYMTQRLLIALQEDGRAEVEAEQRVREAVHRVFIERGIVEDPCLAAMDKFFHPYGAEGLKEADARGRGAVLRSDAEVLDVISLYEQIRREGSIPRLPFSREKARLVLTGLARSRQGDGGETLIPRNRIVRTLFEASWIERRRAGLRRPLLHAILLWDEQRRSDAYLLRGAPLDDALSWAAGRNDLTVDERTYLDASRLSEQRLRAKEAMRQRVLLGALISMTLIAFGAAIEARRQAARAGKNLEEVTRTVQRLNREKDREALALLEANRVTLMLLQEEPEHATDAVALALRVVADPTTRSDGFDLGDVLNTLGVASVARRGLPTFTLRGDGGGVTACAFSPEDDRVITAGRDGAAIVWDARTGARRLTLSDGRSPLLAASWSNDGEWVATGSQDGTVRVWDPRSARMTRMSRAHRGAITSLRWSRDNQHVLTAGDDGVTRIWHAPTGAVVRELAGTGVAVTSARWSADDRLVALASRDGTTRIWDVVTGALRPPLSGHAAEVTSVEWSPDNTSLLTASADRAFVWDARTGERRCDLRGHVGAVKAALWSPDGRSVVTASDDGTARVWDAATCEPKHLLRGHEGAVLAARWSFNGTTIVTVGDDGAARVWDARTGALRALLRGHDKAIVAVHLSTNGQNVVTASEDGTARLWDLADSPLARSISHDGTVLACDWSPDGAEVITAGEGNVVNVWGAQRFERRQAMIGHAGAIVAAQWAHRGRRIVTASRDGTARVWNASTGTQSSMPLALGSALLSASWSSDDERIVTVGFRDGVRGWDSESRGRVEGATLDRPDVGSASWSHRDHRVVATAQHVALVWDTDRGLASAVTLRHDAAVLSAEWSPDDTRIVTTSEDGRVRIWNPVNGAMQFALTGHTGRVHAANWSPRGTAVASAGQDGTLRIWDARTGVERQWWAAHAGGVIAARWSPTDQRVLTVGEDGAARIWDVANPTQRLTLRGQQRRILSARWSPDGTRVITASADDTARVHVVSMEVFRRFYCDAIRQIERVWDDADSGDIRLVCLGARIASDASTP